MKNTSRQAVIIILTLATLAVNSLANILPFNGLNTGEISDKFKVYFVPEGYVFSIWLLIYLFLIFYAVFQALPSQRENPRLIAAGPWIMMGYIANMTWMFLWHYEQFPLTFLFMLILLGSLILTYLKLDNHNKEATIAEKWTTQVTFSIYLGWVSVATIANATDLLYYWNWDGFGISPEIWFAIILVTVLILNSLMTITRRDIAYSLVILWALAGIGIKQANVPVVSISAWVTFSLVLLESVYLIISNLKRRKTLQTI